MSKTSIGQYKTFAMIQSNAPKLQYGSAHVGAGFKDKYQDFKRVRGEFKQKNSTRELEDGTIVKVNGYQFKFRYDNDIMSVLDLQLRLIIEGDTYTLISWDVDKHGRNTQFIFELSQYGK